MIEYILDRVVMSLGLTCLAVFVHEIGHALHFRYYLKKDVKIFIRLKPFRIQTGSLEDYQGLQRVQLQALAISGIIAGFIPYLFVQDLYVLIPSMLFYILGLRKDFFVIWRNRERENEMETVQTINTRAKRRI